MSSRTTVSIRQAATLMGVGNSTAYAIAREGKFPVPVIKIGGRYVVPTKPLLDLLGLDELPDLEKESA